MTDRQCAERRPFLASITFRCGTEAYASECIKVWALDEFDAERLARLHAEDSPYHDTRVPELNLVVEIEPDPDADPPASVTGLGNRRLHHNGDAIP